MLGVGCLVSEAQPTRAGLRERSLDGVGSLVSHPVNFNEKFVVGHGFFGKIRKLGRAGVMLPKISKLE